MKLYKIFSTIILTALFAVLSCNQDPIFYGISTEPPPQEPLIKGAPTNIVMFEREYEDPLDSNLTIMVPIMYVASGRLHWYAKTEMGTGSSSAWNSGEYSIRQPAGRIISLAVTEQYMYALTMPDHSANTILRRIGHADTEWTRIDIEAGVKTSLQLIFADPSSGWLFAGGRSGDGSSWPVFYISDNDSILKQMEFPDTEDFNKHYSSLLSGAISHNGISFLCFRGGGIIQVNETDLSGLPPFASLAVLADNSDIEEDQKSKNRQFMGMIKLADDMILAIERGGGFLYGVNDGSFERVKYTGEESSILWIGTGNYATGALALWEQNVDENPHKRLISGGQEGLYNTTSTSYTYGYFEFVLNADGSLDTGTTRLPPNVTVDGLTDRYTATIGKHPINYFFQAPKTIDDNMTFFASTQTTGLWSYKDRPDSGGLQWNAEN